MHTRKTENIFHLKRILLSLSLLPILCGCAGFPLPFTDMRAFNFQIETNHKRKAADCIEGAALHSLAVGWEQRYLEFVKKGDQDLAIDFEEFKNSFGPECQTRLQALSASQIKNELFGDLQTINNPERLQQLGGISLSFSDMTTIGGIETSLHFRSHETGPNLKLVGIYSLKDDKLIFYNYSGTLNVDERNRRWPIEEFFGAIFGTAVKAIPVD